MTVNIAIGYSSFGEVRRENICYVDKTGFLEKLLSPSSARVTLFTRPRRFGKTLAMSMMAEFLDITKQSGDLFNGLKISANRALCDQWMNQYPVVFMSLQGIDGEDFDGALASFRVTVMNVCAKYGQLRESARVLKEDRNTLIAIRDRKAGRSELQGALATLTRALKAYYGRPAIVLIDEYDVPVANAWRSGCHGEMIDFMRGFLGAALKDNDSLKFGVLTGCLSITRESIFTGFNNLRCCGVGDDDDDFAGMFGFTGDEVDALLAGAGLSDMKDVVREWYGGYRFGNTWDIHCPWGVLSYLDYAREFPAKALKAWWADTSANELTGGFVDRLFPDRVSGRRSAPAAPSAGAMLKTFDEVRSRLPLLWAGMSIAATVERAPSYETLYDSEDNFWTLLYMTGYLTRARDAAPCVDTPGEGRTMLAIPNRDAREAFMGELDVWFRRALPEKPDKYFQAFWEADAGRFEKLVTGALLPGSRFPGTRGEMPLAGETRSETFYHGTLMGLFIRSGYALLSGREEGGGRRVLSVADRDASRAAIIEVAATCRIEDLDGAARKGLERIAGRGRDRRLRQEGYRTILHWSMAFCGKQCRARARLIDAF